MNEQQAGADFAVGSAIVFADEIYFVEESSSRFNSGRVRVADDSYSLQPFYWTFEGEPCRLATKAELLGLPESALKKAALALLN